MNQTGGIIFTTIIGLWLVIGIPWLIVKSGKAGKAQRAKFEKLRGLMDGGEAKVGAWGLEGRFRGRQARVEVRPGSRRGPPRLSVRLDCSARWGFYIVDAHRVGLRGPEVPDRLQVGDADLDQRFLFGSKDAERFKKWALAPENKKEIANCLTPSASGDTTGWSERRFLELSHRRLEWRATHYPDEDLAPEALRGLSETLDQLAHSLESS